MESTFALPNLPFIPPSLSLTATPPISQPATIKMEDLETNNSTSSRALSVFDDGDSSLDTPSLPAGTFSAASSDQKTSKKRRSWGQVLPEPTTNLPPRKRAKTADEKEQRRIERVKRNRLAAHNSRERKRQEVEALQILNQDLEDKLEKMREIASQQDAQLRYFRQMCPDAASGAPFACLQASLDKTLHQNPFESLTSALSVSTTSSSSSTSQQAGPASPGLPNLTSANATPDSLAHTLDSFSMPSTPNAEYAPGTDLTQHSAAMLCPDLQCQSDSRRAPSSAMATMTSTAASPCSRASAMIFSLLLILTSLTISSATSAAISAYLTMSRYFPTRLTSPSTLRSLCRQPSSSRSPKTTAQTTQTMWVDLLMACLPIRSPAQAQQFLLATSLALRRSNGLESSTPRPSEVLSPARPRTFSSVGLEARFRELLAKQRRRRATELNWDLRETIDDLSLK